MAATAAMVGAGAMAVVQLSSLPRPSSSPSTSRLLPSLTSCFVTRSALPSPRFFGALPAPSRRGLSHINAIQGASLSAGQLNEKGVDEKISRVVDWLAEDFRKTDGVDLLKDEQIVQRLTEAVQKAKVDLLSLSQTRISLPYIIATADGPKHLDKTLTRDKFEELCSDLLDRQKSTEILTSNSVAHRTEKLYKEYVDMVPADSLSDDFTSRDSMQSAIQWRCVESIIESERLRYGRFAVSPLRTGQANTVGVALRRALLGEVEGSAITCAKFKNVTHEYAAISGIQETVLDIMLNLKEVVVRSTSHETQKGFLSKIGPGEVTAGDFVLPPFVEVTDPTQHIALLTKAIPFEIEIEVEKDCGYRTQDPSKSADGCFYIDAVFMPVRNANYSVHSFESGDKTQEILFVEIWTNGSISPEEALYQAARCLIDLFLPFLNAEKKEVANRSENEHGLSKTSDFSSFLPSVDQVSKEVTYRHVFIDQLKLPARAYNCLKRANIHTLSDLLNYTQDDLLKIKNFGKKSVEEVLEALRSQFSINLPKNVA